MAMVDVDGSSHLWRLAAQVGGLGLRVGVHQAFSLHSSNELGELSQWLWSWWHWQHHKHYHSCCCLLLLLFRPPDPLANRLPSSRMRCRCCPVSARRRHGGNAR